MLSKRNNRLGWRLSSELVLWHSLALAVLCIGIGLASQFLLLHPLTEALPREAEAFAEAVAEEIQEPLWLLDSGAIKQLLKRHRMYPALQGIRVDNQFGDVLAEWRTPKPLDSASAIQAVHRVHYRDEEIGTVYVQWSSYAVAALRAGLWPALLAITIGGIFVQCILTWLMSYHFLRVPFASLISSLREVARGNFDVALPPSRHQELRLLLFESRRMAGRIKQRTERMNQEINERRAIEEELVKHRDHLEELALQRTKALDVANRTLMLEMELRKKAQKAIINVSTREQQRIGQDLHDTLGQELVAARFLLGSLERVLAAAPAPYSDRGKQLGIMLQDMMEHARMLAHGLMVVDLREGGLTQALRQSAEKTSRLFSVDCTFEEDLSIPMNLDGAGAVQLYYIVQEAITNAIRHGAATKIRLRIGSHREHTTIWVTDNGRGFVQDSASDGMGLIIMRNRAESINAELSVWSKPGRGTCIRVFCGF
ncbi:MAG TPA: hypothetical protein DCS43_13225 [Verrucomicrobia bacterium]|nr:hypothetical protein [Verrucomicrobiota bacterium]